MKNMLISGAVLLALAGAQPATAAEADDLAALKAQVQALMQRIEQLESKAAQPPADEPAPRVAEAQDLDWARRLKWKGDLRYRHEQLDIEGAASDRVRHRIRARFGLEAKIGDELVAGLRLASGDITDPRSTNATLDDASRRKELSLDQAYVTWRAFNGGALTFGKQKQPWFTGTSSMFFDSDVNPEGIALQYETGTGLFASAWGFWLEESAAQADSNLVGLQVGHDFRQAGLTLAVGYWDYGAIQDQPVLAFSGAPAGNSTYTGNGNCTGIGTTRCYLYDYDVVVVDAQWAAELGSQPLVLSGSYLRNLDADRLDTGFNLGFTLGKAGNPGSWEFGALYQDVERDAQFAALLDSDLADGLTQGRGFVLQGAYAPLKNMVLKSTLYLNERSYGTPAEADYKRLQLDLNFRF